MNRPFSEEEWRLCPEEIPARVLRAAKKSCDSDKIILADPEHPSRGYCYQCGETVKAGPGYRYKWRAGWDDCPACGKRSLICYADSSTMWDAQFIDNIATIQRGLDGESVWVRQWHVKRLPERGWHGADQLVEVARYAIRGKYTGKWQKEHRGRYYGNTYYDPLPEWKYQKQKRTVIYDDYFKMALPDRRTMKSITRGTSLQYMDLHSYVGLPKERYENRVRNEIRYMADFTGKRAYELLWKAGYYQLCLNNQGYYYYAGRCSEGIRWSADSIEKALGLPKRIIRMIEPEKWDCLRLWQATLLREFVDSGRITESEWKAAILNGLTPAEAKRVLDVPAVKLGRAIRYTEKQSESFYYYSDYISEAADIGLDMTDPQVLYPRDLRAAHARTTIEKKYKTNQKLERGFASRVKKLTALSWTMDGFIIGPAVTGEQLIEEGKALHHCVGGYIERVARGECAIFFVRRAEAPEIPFFTLELRGKSLVQCRTLNNRSYETEPEVQAFVDRWLSECVEKRAAA